MADIHPIQTFGGHRSNDRALLAAFRSDTKVEAIGLRLIGCTLPKAEWAHAAHLAAAVWIAAAWPDLRPARDMPSIIRVYTFVR